jgi:Prokaryotic E2 family A/Prokaryotic homologs of the JAB domain/ThiF family
MPYDLDALFGPVVNEADLALGKSKGVVRYAKTADYVKLIECRRSSDGVEAVVCDLEIELAQRPVNAIVPLERVAMLFRPADDTYPDVVSLRADFPDVIHLNARPPGRPKSFCLYLEPFDELQLHWTPHLFVERVRAWLAKTADGSLHPEDQGLEPLVFLPFGTLVVPRDLLSAKEAPLQLYIVRAVDAEKRSVWIAELGQSGDAPKREFVAACFDCPPQTHGVIRSAPEDLAQLNQFLMPTGFDIVAEIWALLAEWKKSKLFREVESAKLFLILRLPKRRVEGGNVEIIDRLAFLCDCTLKDLDQRLETFEVTHDYKGMIAIPESVATRANIALLPFDVTEEFSLQRAAELNGIEAEARPFCLLGAGAVGGQILDTLLRSGFGTWTVVDLDRLLPHNLARHRLTGCFVGQRKAVAMTNLMNDIFRGEVVVPLCVDVLRPGTDRDALNTATANAAAVCDCTASVPVARAIAAGEVKTRRAVSIFLNPSGNALVVLAEDNRRRSRLDWLEMQYYREVALNPHLLGHLRTAATTRYSNSCRDVTARVSQESITLFAGIGCRAFREALRDAAAQICIWQLDSASQIRRIDVEPEPVIVTDIAAWSVCTDSQLLHSISTFRQLRLPNETGGVLLGSYDMQRRIIYVVAMLPSPPDSEEWPTSYKRGCTGLRAALAEVEERTLLNLEYVGEWHSHPEGAATDMSDIDKVAMTEIAGEMAKAGLPGLMWIASDSGSYAIHLAES